MEHSPIGSPTKPHRASSEGPTPPPRSSMEDGDSSVTRKRPRLDSGARARRSISAEPLSVAAPDSARLSGEPGAAKQDIIMEDQTTAPSSQPANGPPSKVTINIREPTLAKSPLPEVDGNSSKTNMEEQDKSTEEEVATSVEPGEQEEIPHTPAPRTPSPLGSPEIEVAEPEDANGHIGPTVWLRAGPVKSRPERQQEILLKDFPYLRDFGDLTLTMNKLQGSFQQGRNPPPEI
jgi:hypothetical protein